VIHQIGFISDGQVYQELKSYAQNTSLNPIGFASISDFEKQGNLDNKLLRDFANRVDAVVIAQVSELSTAIICELIKQGKHILFLENMVDILDSLKDIPKLLIESRSILQFANMERNKPLFTSVRQLIKEPKYIKIERWSKQKNNLQSLLLHDIDMVLHCFQAAIKSVNCQAKAIFTNQIDMIMLSIEFNNGANADIVLHSSANMENAHALFVDNKRYYKVDFSENKIIEVHNDASNQLSLITADNTSVNLIEHSRKVMQFDALKKEFQNFDENITFGFTPLANIDDAQKIAFVFQKANEIMHRNCTNWV